MIIRSVKWQDWRGNMNEFTMSAYMSCIAKSNKVIVNHNLVSQRDAIIHHSILTNPMLNNPNYDCSEIADTYCDELGKGSIIIKIEANNGKINQPFVVLEHNRLEQYVNHYVCVKNNVVFDPRFAEVPVYMDYYLQFIQSLNPHIPLKWERE